MKIGKSRVNLSGNRNHKIYLLSPQNSSLIHWYLAHIGYWCSKSSPGTLNCIPFSLLTKTALCATSASIVPYIQKMTRAYMTQLANEDFQDNFHSVCFHLPISQHVLLLQAVTMFEQSTAISIIQRSKVYILKFSVRLYCVGETAVLIPYGELNWCPGIEVMLPTHMRCDIIMTS